MPEVCTTLYAEVSDIVQEAVIKTIPKKKKGKMVIWVMKIFFV